MACVPQMGVHTSSIYEKNIKMIKEKDDEKAVRNLDKDEKQIRYIIRI